MSVLRASLQVAPSEARSLAEWLLGALGDERPLQRVDLARGWLVRPAAGDPVAAIFPSRAQKPGELLVFEGFQERLAGVVQELLRRDILVWAVVSTGANRALIAALARRWPTPVWGVGPSARMYWRWLGTALWTRERGFAERLACAVPGGRVDVDEQGVFVRVSLPASARDWGPPSTVQACAEQVSALLQREALWPPFLDLPPPWS